MHDEIEAAVSPDFLDRGDRSSLVTSSGSTIGFGVSVSASSATCSKRPWHEDQVALPFDVACAIAHASDR